MTDVLHIERYKFSIADYVVFFLMIFLSTGVGIILAFLEGRKKRASLAEEDVSFGSRALTEYLLGSKQMASFPVAMSLIGGYISAVTILGTPAEIYNYGSTYVLVVFAIMISSLIIAYVFLPVFHIMQVESSYEYLEIRFHPFIRSIASVLFVFDEIVFLPFVAYTPALALSQVTYLKLSAVAFVIIFSTVLYTLFGGMKAVVYTDAWQIYLMLLSVFTVVIVGTYDIGGLRQVYDVGVEGGRVFLNLDTAIEARVTLWAILFGHTFYWLSFNAVNQTVVQRYRALATLNGARLALLYFVIGMVAFISMVCMCGFLIYASFHDCDPRGTGAVKSNDQLLVVYVMHVVGYLQGVPGLFLAGVFGAALSSLSTILHSLGLVVLHDLVHSGLKIETSEFVSIVIVKLTIIIFGILTFFSTFVVDKFGGLFGVCISLTSIAASSTFGIFMLGMLVPWANTVGTAIGGITSAILTSYIALASQAYVAEGRVYEPKLPQDVSGCSSNVTAPEQPETDTSVFILFRMSYFWLSPFGIFVAFFVGAIASVCFKSTPVTELSADLFSPIVHSFLPDECFAASKIKQKPSYEVNISNVVGDD